MAAHLKSNSLVLSHSLKKDEKIVSEASGHLGQNLARIKNESGRLGALNKTARKTTWMVWGTVLFVCVMFVFTFVVMRLFKARDSGVSQIQKKIPPQAVPTIVPQGIKPGAEDEGWLW